ncbi:Cation/H+ exchanger, partial [Fimicolochytrium jonesii]|uniref:Cation/H+ exchanger n=1 Tax=Fimicolochytrium jonesii TaxID=1396493 RepID=UPI0022FEF99C
GFVSLIVKERLYLSESLVATLIGIIIGPVCAGLLDPAKWPMETHKVTLAFTEIVIAIQVMAASIALPRSLWKDQRGSLAMLYGPVMMWMWLVSALLIWLILPVPWTQCLILAAALAPTDPVLANSLMTGRFADKYISVPIRHLLSGESAANDGLAVPMFQLGIYLTSYPTKEAWGTWAYHVVLYEIGVGIVFGALVGYVAKCMLRASEKRNYIDKRSFLSVEVALALFVLGFASMLQLASFLSVFATGLIFAWDGWFTEETEEAHVQEVIDNLVNMTFFIYFGAIIPWSTFNQYYALPKLVLLSVLLLILRRLPPVLALHHYLPVLTRRPALLTRREALLVGYFGPVGVGALWYVNYAYDKGAIGEEGMTIVSWVVWCAVVVYGITAVLMHGLVRTLSVVRVYSGRSLNGRTLSLPSAIRGAPMWPSNVRVAAVWS